MAQSEVFSGVSIIRGTLSSDMHLNVLNRKVHYWVSAAIAFPVIVVAVTGCLLQLKKHWTWVQPAEQRGSATSPEIEFSQILESLRAHDSLGVDGWHHVSRMDVRPDRGIVKVTLRSNWEAQIVLGTGRILHVAYRRSDWIESIHDGSIFGNGVKLGVFLPAAAGLALLWLGGVWMFTYPFIGRRRVRRSKLA